MSFEILKRRLLRLMKNNRAGAGALENQLYGVFISGAQSLDRRKFHRLIEIALSWHPPMANILNLISFVQRKSAVDFSALCRLLMIRRRAIRAERERLYRLAGRRIASCATIATISHSTAVEKSLRAAVELGWRGNILIPESRPALEGRALARRLSILPVGVEFGVDTLILSMLDRVDAAFVGTDLITESHFVNKIGTTLLARSLPPRKFLYVLADSTKFWRKKIPGIPSMPSAEIWKYKSGKINIYNRYFELVPLSEQIRIIRPEPPAASFE